METLTRFAQNPLIGFASLLLGLIALLLSYVFFRRSRRLKEPCWAIRSNNLVTGFTARFPQLDIRYRDVKVENMTVSKVLFWNNGTDTIHRGDIAEADRLRIVPSTGTKILDVSLLAANSQASRFEASLAPDQNVALMTFDFIDQHQGAVLQIIHTGLSSGDLTLKGTIKGARPARMPYVTAKISYKHGESLFNPGTIIGAVILLAVGAYAALFQGNWVGIAIFSGPAAFFALARYMELRMRWVPPGLEQYRED